MRQTLVAALVSCAGAKVRNPLRRFLTGLSADELEFLAGFQGARILESSAGQRSAGTSRAPAGAPAYYGAATSEGAVDLDHKMIVLREYLSRCECSSPAH